MMGEWGRNIKEISLMEFQQWVGKKVVPDEFVDQIEYSQSKRAISKRKYRNKLKEKKDYENFLREMREEAKKK